MKCKRCNVDLADWAGFYMMLCNPCLRDLNERSKEWTRETADMEYYSWLDELKAKQA